MIDQPMVLVVRTTRNGGGGAVDSKKTCSLSSSDKSGCFHFSKRDLMFSSKMFLKVKKT